MRFAPMLIAAAVVGLPASRATAGPPAAEALFQEGRQLLEAGQVDEACLRLAESYSQEPASGTLLNLARCHQTQGKIATAWAEYRAAARLSRAQGREDRARAAEEQASALEPKLSRLKLRMSEPPAGLKVLTDADVLGEGGFGVAIPIDPGHHNVTASAKGYKTWTTTIDIREAESRELVIPALELEAVAPEPVAIEAAPPAPKPTPPPERVAPTGLGKQRTAALITGGVGVVGVVVGSIFGVQSIVKHDRAAPNCPDSVCANEYWIGVQTDAHTAGNVSTAFFAIGGVGLAAAAVLWFTGKPSQAASTQLRLGMGSIVVRRVW
jgi:hypothetical protein